MFGNGAEALCSIYSQYFLMLGETQERPVETGMMKEIGSQNRPPYKIDSRDKILIRIP